LESKPSDLEKFSHFKIMKTILFLASGTKEVTKLDLEKEAASIEQELKRLGRNEVFEFKVELAQTAEDLRHALVDHQPQVIHFAGHGSGSSGIVLGQQELLRMRYFLMLNLKIGLLVNGYCFVLWFVQN
jgi:CHAT domain-containing protein